MDKKILILGKGYIGRRLAQDFECDVSDKRINSFTDADDEIKKYNPQVVINCIGSTGANNVDDCEVDIDNTLYANTFIPIILAEAALRNQVKFIHISSGCIFHYDYEKDSPISEDKIPDYFDLFYSRSKIYAERALDVLIEKYNFLTARIRVPLDNRPCPKNVLTKLIKYKKVIDIPNSVTYIPDFIEALRHLINKDSCGIYNIVNKGVLRYPPLMRIYKKYVPDFEYKVIEYSELNMDRTNLVLSVDKLEQSGFKIREINEVLEECVREYVK
ncbi:MAG: NAD-dependent epimerase/dehydratase family protein [Candidatus Omnitrophota bacterium]|nr:NAD-dependent epimerase/dehydratase family protein [Candidatus Omnitrophota bacterium]